MKRAFYLISLFVLSGLLAMSFITSAQAETKGKPKKEVILTTTDIKDSYKVIGIISTRTGETNLDTLNDKLKEAAKDLGADYVIGVRYFYVQGGYLYAYGTAVKIKE
ncbi:MAG: selenium-binding protein [Candidatus Omnitrophota bacterium]|nr:selenium-binding protein [Candidatus Omnitrophota bacterium]